MGWRVHHGRLPDEQLLRTKRRYWAVPRPKCTMSLRRFYRRAKVAALAASAAAVFYLDLTTLPPWPPITALRHIAASPNCTAARAVGLAPAYSGQPGYWPSHDRDGDGIACEPWPRW